MIIFYACIFETPFARWYDVNALNYTLILLLVWLVYVNLGTNENILVLAKVCVIYIAYIMICRLYLPAITSTKKNIYITINI